MSGIKYYQLAKDEEIPDEFCVVRDVGGEPSEYTFYLPESKVAELRELARDLQHAIACLVVLGDDYAREHEDELCAFDERMRELRRCYGKETGCSEAS